MTNYQVTQLGLNRFYKLNTPNLVQAESVKEAAIKWASIFGYDSVYFLVINIKNLDDINQKEEIVVLEKKTEFLVR